VRAYHIPKGVSPARLDAKGYGPSRPVLPNTSNANRAVNRRVEFNIVEQGPKK
jgi:OOP family OmpA-OmpF porin